MKISIVTVTLNCSKVVEDCLRSVRMQSYTDIQHIVIDGASSDGTLDILRKYGNQLDIIISETDDGIYDAMNKGISLCTGEIIGILNADDFFAHANVLESVANCFSSDPLLDACYSDLVYVDQIQTSKVVRFWKSTPFVGHSFSKGWCLPHPTLFVDRRVYEKFGVFDKRYEIASDVELMIRLLEIHNIRVQYIPDIWVKMRTGGISNNKLSNIVQQNFEILQALRRNNVSVNPLLFFLIKFLARMRQFFVKMEHF